MPITVSWLADDPAAINVIADLRWREWGHPPEPEDPAWWLETTIREAGRTGLPVTFVARDEAGIVLGAVGLDEFDLDERRDTSPWVTGMIVRPDRRGEGIGRVLMAELERWVAGQGIAEVWVGTDLAAGFYERCGWTPLETFIDADGQPISVLHKHFSRERASSHSDRAPRRPGRSAGAGRSRSSCLPRRDWRTPTPSSSRSTPRRDPAGRRSCPAAAR